MPLTKLLHPSSIAIIGASTNPGSVGNDILKNVIFHGFQGKVYPVNPKTDNLYDLRCFPSITEVPEIVDLAIIVIPASLVIAVVEECGQKGIKNIIIISAGFKEIGDEGRERESELVALIKKYDLTLLGPNCLGFINPHLNLNASFAKQMPEPGAIGFFSQSGALSTALLDMTHESLSFSQFLSVGNKSALSEKDFLTYFNDEEHTKVIGFYSEDFTDAPSFITTGRNLTKPAVALKSGATEAGSRASSSHTGSVAGSDLAYSSLLKQSHILRANTFQQFLDTLLVTSKNTFPEGTQVAVLTNAGGLGVLASDALTKAGLSLASLSEETTKTLSSLLPPAASSHNPVDVLGDAPMKRYEDALLTLAGDKEVHMLLVIVTPQSMTEAKETAEALIRFREQSSLPLVAVFSGKDSFTEAVALLAPHIATYTMPEAGAEALASLATLASFAQHKQTPPSENIPQVISKSEEVSQIFTQARQEQKTQLLTVEVESILAHYGFTFPRAVTITSHEDALENARLFKSPVVLKIVSPQIIHKSDVGGVLLDVAPENIPSAYDTLIETIRKNVPDAAIRGVSVNEQIDSSHGKELLLGIKTEPGLGKALVVGLGGIYVEILKDVSMRFAPLDRQDAKEMVNELKTKAILEGARGELPMDLEALYDAIMALNQLVIDYPEIDSLDINPLLIFPKGQKLLALDARMSVQLD